MVEIDDPLDEMMAAMADGDEAFLFAFIEEFGPTVRRVVRSILTEMGRHDVVRDGDELDGLTIDACWVIFARAGGWRPGGAAPWNWAYKAIRAEVARVIGHRTVELDGDEDRDGEADPRGGAVVDLTDDDLGTLIARHARVRLLDDAIRAVGSPEHHEIYWEYRLQQGLGDPSPAITVGERVGRPPATIRQICKRHGDKVWRLVASDPRFAELRDHGWFAA